MTRIALTDNDIREIVGSYNTQGLSQVNEKRAREDNLWDFDLWLKEHDRKVAQDAVVKHIRLKDEEFLKQCNKEKSVWHGRVLAGDEE